MVKNKTSSRLSVLLLAAFMLLAFAPMFGIEAYAEDTAVEVVPASEGAVWNYMTSPQAVSSGDKTFWTYADINGIRYAASYDSTTGDVVKTPLEAEKPTNVAIGDVADKDPIIAAHKNDLQGASILIMDDDANRGKVMCVFTRTSSAKKVINIAISKQPYDVSEFEEVTAVTGVNLAAYSQVIKSGGKYYVFYNFGTGGSWGYISSSDGVTWDKVGGSNNANSVLFYSAKKYYDCKFVPTTQDDLIRMLISSDVTGDIYTGFFNTSDGKVYNGDLSADMGEPSGYNKRTIDKFTQLTAEEGKSLKVIDAAVTAPDSPRFVFSSYATDNEAVYELYDGGEANVFTEAGTDLVSNNQLGVSFRGTNDLVVAHNSGGKDYIDYYRIVNKRAQLSTMPYAHDASETRAARPIVDTSGKAFLWFEGTYTSASSYNTSAKLMYFDSIMTPDVSIDKDLFIYNGSVQKPVVTIAGLTEGTDYDIVWTDPESKDVGKYELWIQFKGDYAEQSEIGLPYDIIEDPYQLELDAPQPARTWGDFEPVGGFCPNTIATVRATAPHGTGAWVGIYQASDTEYRRDNCFAWASAKAYALEDEDALLDLSNPAEGEVYDGSFLSVGGCYKAVLFEDGTYAKPHAEVIFFILGHHTYEAENTTYTWAEGYTSATAKVTCTFCDSSEEETAASTSEVTTEPTCTEPGVRTYTADFEADRFETQTTTEPVNALGHDWGEPTYTWSDDNSECTAERTCKREGCDVKESEKAVASQTVKKPTCTEKGKVTLTAEFTNEAFAAQTKTVDGEDALGHDWGEWTEAEPSTCIMQGQLVRECKRDPAHKEYKKADLAAHTLEKTDAKEATCTEAGNIEFWYCTVCDKFFKDEEGLNEIAEADTVVTAPGHDYQEVEGTAKPATSKEEGKEADQKCSRCGDVKPGAVIPKLEPTEEEKAAEAAKEELNKAVDEAKKVEQGNYTDESFKALQDAIAEAEALAKDENATKEQLDAAAAKIADAKAALKDKEPEVGTEAEYSGNTYAVTSEPGAAEKTVAFTKAKNSKSVTVPSTMKINGETYKVTSVAAKAFRGSKCTTAYIGANVKKLDKYAFRYSKVKTVYIKSKLLSKTRVKGSLKYSKVTTIKAKVSTKKSTNKSYAKKFKSYFTKANAGKKVTVKY